MPEPTKEFISKKVHEHWVYENERLSHRADYFLIFDVILIECFLSTSSHDSKLLEFQIPIVIFGILINALWAFTSIRTFWLLYDLGNHLRYNKKNITPEMNSVMELMYKNRESEIFPYFILKGPRPATVLAIYIPLISLAVWIAFSCVIIKGIYLQVTIVSVFLIAISFVVYRMHNIFTEIKNKIENDNMN